MYYLKRFILRYNTKYKEQCTYTVFVYIRYIIFWVIQILTYDIHYEHKIFLDKILKQLSGFKVQNRIGMALFVLAFVYWVRLGHIMM